MLPAARELAKMAWVAQRQTDLSDLNANKKVDAVLVCDAVVKHESLSVEDVRFFQRVSLQHREGSSGTPFPPARAKMAWVAQRQTDLSDLNANKKVDAVLVCDAVVKHDIFTLSKAKANSLEALSWIF